MADWLESGGVYWKRHCLLKVRFSATSLSLIWVR
jgi:hypothetical protein